MVFSSIQAYLDSSNWQQVPPSNYNQTGVEALATGASGAFRPQLHQPQPQPPSNASGGGSIRAGSMVDRARQANVAMPETSLKCPRCESTNTKFCYFNNYSLTQPRHFCKTCRRYWTRGGALRNVPVGGGLRRNRRTKSNHTNTNNNNNNNNMATSNNTNTSFSSGSTISAILSSNYGSNQESILRLMNPTYNLGDLTDNTKSDNNNMSFLNYGQDLMRPIHMSGSLINVDQDCSNNTNQSINGFYSNPFETQRISTSASISSALASQFSAVKVEDNPYKWVNVNGNYCSSWTDLSTFGSSR
ncbi:unnamed protein product [Cochlearia groenlandica]